MRAWLPLLFFLPAAAPAPPRCSCATASRAELLLCGSVLRVRPASSSRCPRAVSLPDTPRPARLWVRTTAPTLPSGLLTGWSALKWLSLAGGRVSRLQPDLLSPCPALVRLNLSRNLLTDLPVELLIPVPSLRYLDLSHNLLSWLPPSLLAASPALASLNLAHNRLTQLELGAMHHTRSPLTRLDASHNLLTTVSLATEIGVVFPNLARIDLSHSESLHKCDQKD